MPRPFWETERGMVQETKAMETNRCYYKTIEEIFKWLLSKTIKEMSIT